MRVIDGRAGIRRRHRRAAELTPNRLNQGFSRTFVIHSLILAWGSIGRRMEGKVEGAKEWCGRGEGREGLQQGLNKLREQSGILGRGDGLVSDTVQL